MVTLLLSDEIAMFANTQKLVKLNWLFHLTIKKINIYR